MGVKDLFCGGEGKEKHRELSIFLLRIALSLVFFYFGYSQISNPDFWTGFIPDFVLGFGLSANNFVVFNGMMELVFGLFLILGLYTRFASLVLSLHLFGIALSVGFSPTGVRDFGLAFATLAVFLFGPDKYALDRKWARGKKDFSEDSDSEEEGDLEEGDNSAEHEEFTGVDREFYEEEIAERKGSKKSNVAAKETKRKSLGKK